MNKNIEAIYPLSPMQQGLLFHSLYSPGSGTYVTQISCRIEGGLDVAGFKRSWQAVIDNHSILRTSFLWEGLKEPLQIAHQKVNAPWKEEDWRHLTVSEQSDRLQKFLLEDRRADYDFSRAPLVRLALLKTGKDSYHFVWSSHHIVLDGWCTQLLIQELFARYKAYSRGREVEFKRPRAFREYIAWLRQQDMQQAEAFWREELKGFTNPTPLAWHGGKRSQQDTQRERQVVRIGQQCAASVDELAKRLEITANTIIQGAWALALSRYSGQTDIVFGEVVSGRSAPLGGIESMVGVFINTLPVRVRLFGEEPVGVFLKRLQQRQARVLGYEYSPLAEVQAWSEVSRGTPLFESIFQFQNYPADGAIGGRAETLLRITDVRNFSENHYPLTLLAEPEMGLTLRAVYDCDLFDVTSIDRLLRQARLALEAMIANAEQRISEIELLTEAERQCLIVESNDTEREYKEWFCVHEMVEEQTDATPDAIALVCQQVHLSYASLNVRANRLANYLSGLGVASEVRVAICMKRSPELIIAILGVLKAGGSYVPIDANNPEQRISYMLEDSGAEVVLTEGEIGGRLPSGRMQVIEVDTEEEEISKYGGENPAVGVEAESGAYMIYTSGSTGRPKAVIVTHKGLAGYVRWAAETYQVNECSGSIVHSSIGFDLTITGLIVPLLCGKAVTLVEDTDAVSAIMSAVDISDGASLVKLTPAQLGIVRGQLPDGHSNQFAKILVIGGEALMWEDLQYWRSHSPSTRLINEYGPTETVVGCCVFEAPALGLFTGPVPIGRPIANTRLYVLDGWGELTPLAATGELYIGGDGVARGYWKQAEQTAERFVPDALSGELGARLYRTGDLVRRRPADGELEYLGRVDHQVKVRGYRIEPGEIEAELMKQQAVRQCAVVVKGDSEADKRLVAYIVLQEGEAANREQISKQLGQRLPAYMVPGVYVVMPEMPLTVNGKVDRKRLPEPDEGPEEEREEEDLRARSAIEEIVGGIWAEVLKVRRVGLEDNFFEKGGHSLLATQVMSRVREVMGVEVGLREMFERPTVRGLSEAIEKQRAAGRGREVPAMRRRGRGGEEELSYAQQRLWFINELEPESAAYNIAYAVRMEGEVNEAALEQSMNEIVRRHEVLRTRFVSRGGLPVQVIDNECEVEIPLWDVSHLAEGERDKLVPEIVLWQRQRPFDLRRGSVLRTVLIRLGAEDHVLVVCLHHVVSDGWSVGVMIREFTALCETYRQGERSSLPELEIQYADFAVWQREWLRGEALDEQVQYWKAKLEAIPLLELPTDYPRPPIQKMRGKAESFTLSADVAEGLRELSRRYGVTMFMSILAAFDALLYRYSGQSDIVVGTPIAGRNFREIEGLIGFFVNTLALRADLSGNPSFIELLRRIREVTLEAYAYQEVPFEKLVEEIQPDRSLSHSPIFQVMFVMQNTPREALNLAGVSLKPISTTGETAKFDLTLSVVEGTGGINGLLEYNRDLFEEATIRRMAGHLKMLLKEVSASPERRLHELELLSAREKQQLLEEWNDTASEYEKDKCMHELFEQQAELSPEAVALVSNEEEISYGELNRRANQLAHYLRRLGVGPEKMVGVCLDRSPEMVVSLLAILKAGGAYAPLDPTYPKERVAFMLEDAGATAVITQQSFVGELPEVRAAVVVIDRQATEIRACDKQNPINRASQENLAYVIYTSGSTGRPKAAAIEHRSAVTFIHWAHEAFTREDLDAVLASTSISFDLSVFEIFVPLSCGGKVVMVENALELIKKRQDVTLINTVPSAMGELVRMRAVPESARVVNLAGEALQRALVEEVYEQPGVKKVYNLYGPSEDTTYSTYAEISRRGADSPGIGGPVANTQVRILDSQMALAPIGVKGELCISGEGLARGYLNHAELTAEKFIPDPISGHGGKRLYKTGDQARYRSDGSIDFLGRIDHQVKIRGFRIELGEVETVLAGHAGVRQCVISMREDESGDKHLVAYVVPSDEWTPTAAQLRAHLKESLPGYMLPAAYVLLDEMPLTPNGKIDRRALSGLALSEDEAILRGSGAPYEAPHTSDELAIASVWQEVLKLVTVGIHDNFFDLGGHSFLLVQAHSKLQEKYGDRLTLMELFEYPTINSLATHLNSGQGDIPDLQHSYARAELRRERRKVREMARH